MIARARAVYALMSVQIAGPAAVRTACALLLAQIAAAAAVRAAEVPVPLDREDLVQCAALPAADRRLACYDALATRLGLHPTPGTPPARSTSGNPRTPIPGAASPSESPTPSAGTNSPAADDERLFGLSKPLEPVARGPDSLRANVADIREDSLGNVAVLLDNGQTWTFNDAESLLRKGDSVAIKRAALGSFMMTTPSRRTYRVKRIK